MSNLDKMLDEALRQKYGVAWLDEQLALRTRCCAVMVVDMCGFTRTCENEGLAQALLDIRAMQRVVEAATKKSQGRVVKFEADNAYCSFTSIPLALTAAGRMVDRSVCSVGIGWGVTVFCDNDFYGLEVNLASKLAEDQGQAGDILLTRAAAAIRSGHS
ncbi:MAG: hypothetical protein ACOVKC_03180 [Brevundimonas sp.]